MKKVVTFAVLEKMLERLGFQEVDLPSGHLVFRYPADKDLLLFERRWADGVWQRVLQELRKRYEDEGRSEWFMVFHDYHLAEGARPSQQAVAEAHHLSRDQVREILAKVEKRLERLLRAEFREEGVSEQDMVDEITPWRHLLWRSTVPPGPGVD